MNLKNFLPSLPSGFSNLFAGFGMVSPRKEGSSYFYFARGQQIDLPFKTSFEMAQGIPHLGAVVDKGSEMFSAVRFKVVKTDTDEEEVDDKHSLNGILNNPNKMQTWKQMLYLVYTYKILAGVAFLFPGFGIARRASNLAFLTAIDFDTFDKEINHRAKPYANDDLDSLISNIHFHFKYTPSVSFKPSELIWVKDRFMNYIDDYSRIPSLLKNVENIYKTLVSRGVLIDKKGGIGMISGSQKDSGQSLPLIPKEKKKLERKLSGYGLGNGGDPMIITDVPLRYTPFVYPTRELMLFEEIEDDFNTICDRLGINRELFDGKTTFANKKMAETSTYQNTIVPAWIDFFDLLNKELDTAGEKRKIIPDWAHVEALQKSKQEEVNAQATESTMLLSELDRNIISLDEYRQQMDYAPQTHLPKEDSKKEVPASSEEQAALRGSVGGVQGILAVQAGVSNGTTTRDAALSIFTIIYGFTEEQANALLGDPEEATNEPPTGNIPPQFGGEAEESEEEIEESNDEEGEEDEGEIDEKDIKRYLHNGHAKHK